MLENSVMSTSVHKYIPYRRFIQLEITFQPALTSIEDNNNLDRGPNEYRPVPTPYPSRLYRHTFMIVVYCMNFSNGSVVWQKRGHSTLKRPKIQILARSETFCSKENFTQSPFLQYSALSEEQLERESTNTGPNNPIPPMQPLTPLRTYKVTDESFHSLENQIFF